MQNMTQFVAGRREALEKRLEGARSEAQGMIRAMRRKLDDLEGRLTRKATSYVETDAAVEEALTLGFRLSRLVSLELQAAAAREIEKAVADLEAAVPLVTVDEPKPDAAEIPGMDDDDK